MSRGKRLFERIASCLFVPRITSIQTLGVAFTPLPLMCAGCSSKVAIKRIKPYCGDEWEARHTLREVRLMRLLGVHPNVISLMNCWTRDEAGDSELYIVMELMDSDLHQIIQSKQQLSEPHHQCLMKQLLLGVQAMHRVGVLHRDLKPGNLLVTRDCQLRITDFGLARAWDRAAPSDAEAVGAMTEYVVTRWYRCPELLLAPHLPYDGAIDLWSVGCIFAELLNRRPLFPGKSYVHQVQVILDGLGTPPDDAESGLGFAPRDDAATFLKRQRFRPPVPFARLLPAGASPDALGLFEGLLRWNPRRRLDVAAALAHPWLQNCPQLPCGPEFPLEKLLAHKARTGIDFGFEASATPLAALRGMVVAEVAAFQTDRGAALGGGVGSAGATGGAGSTGDGGSSSGSGGGSDGGAVATGRLPPAPGGGRPQSPPAPSASAPGGDLAVGAAGGRRQSSAPRGPPARQDSSGRLTAPAEGSWSAAASSGQRRLSAQGLEAAPGDLGAGLSTGVLDRALVAQRKGGGLSRRGSLSGLVGVPGAVAAAAGRPPQPSDGVLRADELRQALAGSGSKFGKLEGHAGMGGIPARRTLPQMPAPAARLGGGGGGPEAAGGALLGGAVVPGGGAVPRPGSRQMIAMLRANAGPPGGGAERRPSRNGGRSGSREGSRRGSGAAVR